MNKAACVLVGQYLKFGADPECKAQLLFSDQGCWKPTQLPSCLAGYLFENDSRVVPEKFEGERAQPFIPTYLHASVPADELLRAAGIIDEVTPITTSAL